MQIYSRFASACRGRVNILSGRYGFRLNLIYRRRCRFLRKELLEYLDAPMPDPIIMSQKAQNTKIQKRTIKV
jgi:hypothetical protein